MTILGSRNSADLFPYVIKKLTSGDLKAEKLITHRFAFDEIVDAFDFSSKNIGKTGKVIIEFND